MIGSDDLSEANDRKLKHDQRDNEKCCKYFQISEDEALMKPKKNYIKVMNMHVGSLVRVFVRRFYKLKNTHNSKKNRAMHICEFLIGFNFQCSRPR